MSRNDPLDNPTGAGMTGDALRTPEEGTARVESRLTGGQGTDTSDRLAGVREEAEEMVDRAAHRAREAWDETRERASEWTDRAGEWTDRAGELASRAGHEIGGVLERAETRIEEQTGAITMIRDHPLLAAGAAFGVGFLMAGDTGRKRGLTGRAAGQLRGALMGGVSTLLMQELQELLDEHGGPAGLLNALTGRSSEEQ